MACKTNTIALSDMLELLINYEPDGLRTLVERLYNEAMVIERNQHLGASAHERTESRTGHANGFKNKRLNSRVGELNLSVPQVRDSSFYPSSLEKGARSERALLLSLAEMYVQGVSTRKVKAIVEELCGLEVSSSQVSRAAKLLDETLTCWRNRPLGEMHYLYLDARYEKVRHGGHVVDGAVLVATGVDARGFRHVLGVSVSLSEQEGHWRQFMQSLVERGLHGLELIISDAHAGLKAAKRAVWPSVSWQRCQFHLQQNAQSYVPQIGLKKPVASSIRHIFNAPNREEAERLLAITMEEYTTKAPKLVEWMAENIAEGLTCFSFPESHQRRIRTNNMLERVNREIRRRTRVASIFPNEASCLRLVTAVLMEMSEEWETGKCYLTMTE